MQPPSRTRAHLDPANSICATASGGGPDDNGTAGIVQRLASIVLAVALGPLLHRKLAFVAPLVQNRRQLLELFATKAAPLLSPATPQALLALLETREAQQSTVLTDGVAFPHAIGEGVPATLVGVAKLDPPLTYDERHAPITLCFALFGDSTTPSVHVRTLARLARVVSNPAARARLEQASTGRDLLEVLRQHDAA